MLGGSSLRDMDGAAAQHVGKVFTCGTCPPRLAGIKGYSTSEDEVVLEIPLIWGSDCIVRGGGGSKVASQGMMSGAISKGARDVLRLVTMVPLP